MAQLVSTQTVWINADGQQVDEDDPDARLVAREGAAISKADADRYGVSTQDAVLYDAVADHAAKHGGETEAQARAARERMFANAEPGPDVRAEDPDGAPAEGERGNLEDEKAAAPKANKAKAPADNK